MSSIVVETQRIRAGRTAWQSGLASEIISLEDNLDKLYQTAGLKAHRILQLDEADQLVNQNNNNNKSNKDKEAPNYEDVIDGQLLQVKQSATNICSLINSVTEFDIPIPAYVLLRLATRLASLRWTDYSKKSGGSLAKRYTYSKSSELISTSLMMFKWISYPLGTNIIPFQPFINQNILNILEWTRASGLSKHNLTQYLALRSQAFDVLSECVEQLSLNINLNAEQLKNLIQIELVASLKEELTNLKTSVSNSLRDKYIVDVLSCLDKLFIVYGQYFDAQLEQQLKTFVIEIGMDIYRDFERNVIGLAGRRQLLKFVETIANQPYATSTTEIAWHLFELAEMLETDAEIRNLARRSLKLGLAHRPVIVSHHDVYNCHSRPMTSTDGDESLAMLVDKQADEDGQEMEESDHQQVECYLPAEVTSTPVEATGPKESDTRQPPVEGERDGEQPEQIRAAQPESSQAEDVNEHEQVKVGQAAAIEESQTAPLPPPPTVESSPVNVVQPIEDKQQDIDIGDDQQDKSPLPLQAPSLPPPPPPSPPQAKPLECASDKVEDDPEVESCMSLFVSKPAS